MIKLKRKTNDNIVVLGGGWNSELHIMEDGVIVNIINHGLHSIRQLSHYTTKKKEYT